MQVSAAAPMAAPALERWAWLRVADQDLSDVRAMPPGEPRRTAAIERMRDVTRDGAGPARDALAAAIAAAGADATVELREQLWLDGSAVVRVAMPSAEPDTARAVDEILARAGARAVDPADLPAGIGSAARASGFADSPGHVEQSQWFADELGFTAARASGLTGEGVRVAVVDGGIDASHPQLVGALSRGAVLDLFPGVEQRVGHGTYVSGIVAGAHTGLAPGVDLTLSRTYGESFGDQGGEDAPSRIAQRVNAVRAVQEALAPADGRRGADVLVTSWGILSAPGVPARDYDRAMATVAAAGAVVVAASGNDGDAGNGSTIAVPAQLDDVLAAGGVDRQLRWHPKASAGPSPRTDRPKPDLSAPVVDIRSTAPGGGTSDTSGNGDGGFGGTSAAAPAAAALVALLTQAIHDRGGASPDLDEVRRVLPLLTRDVDAPGPDSRTGFGVIDARRVHQAAAAVLAAR